MNNQSIPADVLADLLEIPEFAQRVKVQKIYRGNTVPRESTVRKGLIVNFRDILQGHSTRDLGDPPAPVPLASAAAARPTDNVLASATPETWSQQRTTSLGARGANTPKAPPAASRPASTFKPENYQTMGEHLAEAIDAAIAQREKAQREALAMEAFNAKRSAFNRLSATKSDGKPQGTGNAWGLRNIGGRMAAAALGLTASKGEGQALPTSSAWRPMSGAALRG